MNFKRTAAWCAWAVALALVFAAYLRPDVAFTFATQLWQCL